MEDVCLNCRNFGNYRNAQGRELKLEDVFAFYSKSSLMLNDPYSKKTKKTQAIRHYALWGEKNLSDPALFTF